MASKMSWKEEAAEYQQMFLKTFGEYDWDLYLESELPFIEHKVSYYLYGPCDIEELKPDVRSSIKSICSKIIKEDCHLKKSKNEVLMTVVYVSMSVSDVVCHEPVFKVPKDTSASSALYIDIHARVYKDWNDFLENNLFPPCDYCYPKDGEYSIDENDKIVLEFGISPSKKPSEKVLVGLDYTSMAVSAAAAITLFLPVAGPVAAAALWAGGASSVYTTVRSTSSLVDKKVHKQSIGLGDPQSRNCWLTIAGSTVGIAAMGATAVTARMAQAGQVLGKTGCVTVNALNVGAVGMNGLGILNHAVCLIEKKDKDGISVLDVVQFSASIFLFAHAAVNVKTARTIIKETQTNVINDFKASLRSNRHRKAFNKVAKNTVNQQGTLKGNAQIIRSMKHISNVDDFFGSIVRMDKQVRGTGSKITMTEHGLIEMNQQLSVDPTKFIQLDKTQRNIIFKATKNFASSSISEEHFRNLTTPILEQVSSFPPAEPVGIAQTSVQSTAQSRAQSTAESIESHGIFYKVSAVDKATVLFILSKFTAILQDKILVIAMDISKKMGFAKGERICEVVYCVCGFIRGAADELGSSYEQNSGDPLSMKTWGVYCTIVLRKIVPEMWIEIFKHCSTLYQMLRRRRAIEIKYDHIGIFEVAQCASILIKFDVPLYERLIDAGLYIFDELRCKEGITLFIIIKLVCIYIKKAYKDLKQKYEGKNMSVTDMLKEEAKEKFKDICEVILDSILEDKEVKKALMETVTSALHADQMESVTSALHADQMETD